MPKHQAVIFDIDGTAVDSPAKTLPTERLAAAVKNLESKYYICAATGRPWPFAEPVITALGLADPCIISSGTQICEPKTGKIIWQCDIASDDLVEIKKVLADYPDERIVTNDFSEEDYHSGGVLADKLDINRDINVIGLVYVAPAVAEEVAARLSHLSGIECTLVVSHEPGQKDLHITNKTATKEHAVSELLQIISIDRAHTTGIGDGHNDVHLFRGVHHKVAMGNAVPDLKAEADEVIGNVADDGLAEYFERLRS